MWNIVNKTPFQAKGVVTSDYKTCRKTWLVAVKATFDIGLDGNLNVSDNQGEILDAPEYFGEEGNSSLRYDSDLRGIKEYVDVTLNGTGYQPGGIAKKELTVGLGIGNWSKLLSIKGDRLWDRFLGVALKTSSQYFSKMPICYENAYGGEDKKAKEGFQIDFRNNIGKGYSVRRWNLFGKELPNIEYPDQATKSSYKKNKVAGFGAIPDFWIPRIDFAGTYNESWQEERAPYVPLDFSPRYYQSAPEDQQLSYVPEGAKVVLMNLMPANPEFVFHLPVLSFDMITSIADTAYHHKPELKTIIIEPDVPRLIMGWQTAIDCHQTEHMIKQSLLEVLSDDEKLLPLRDSLSANMNQTDFMSPNT